jgi:hypothetical protein
LTDQTAKSLETHESTGFSVASDREIGYSYGTFLLLIITL